MGATKPIAKGTVIKPATHVEMTKAGFVFKRDQLVKLEQLVTAYEREIVRLDGARTLAEGERSFAFALKLTLATCDIVYAGVGAFGGPAASGVADLGAVGKNIGNAVGEGIAGGDWRTAGAKAIGSAAAAKVNHVVGAKGLHKGTEAAMKGHVSMGEHGSGMVLDAMNRDADEAAKSLQNFAVSAAAMAAGVSGKVGGHVANVFNVANSTFNAARDVGKAWETLKDERGDDNRMFAQTKRTMVAALQKMKAMVTQLRKEVAAYEKAHPEMRNAGPKAWHPAAVPKPGHPVPR